MLYLRNFRIRYIFMLILSVLRCNYGFVASSILSKLHHVKFNVDLLNINSGINYSLLNNKFMKIAPLNMITQGLADTGLVAVDVASSGLWRYFFAGGIGCAFSHGVAVPFDVVKTKMQLLPEKYGSIGIIGTTKTIIQDDGPGMLLQGFGPTLIGYTLQGGLKYGFYEIFKLIMSPLIADSGMDVASLQGRLFLFAVSGALADSIGSLALSPFESARIRLVCNPAFSTGLIDSLFKIATTEGLPGLYIGLPAILLRQLPYTAVQLSIFELMTTQLYTSMMSAGWTLETLSPYKILISATSALTAGVLATLASQPGDTILSRVNSQCELQGASDVDTPLDVIVKTCAELGLVGLFRGTGARILHISVMVVIQLLAYDFVKQLCGIPATGLH